MLEILLRNCRGTTHPMIERSTTDFPEPLRHEMNKHNSLSSINILAVFLTTSATQHDRNMFSCDYIISLCSVAEHRAANAVRGRRSLNDRRTTTHSEISKAALSASADEGMSRSRASLHLNTAADDEGRGQRGKVNILKQNKSRVREIQRRNERDAEPI